ncbi:MAG: amidase [Anaerolineales bacterium]|jgi:amidase
MPLEEFIQKDAIGLAEWVRSGEVSPLELVEETIRRIEAVNPQVNAVIHKMYDQAREKATGVLPEGPFMGVPFLVKDMRAPFKGEPMWMGSRFLKGYVPDYDYEVIRRYKQAGLITLGKTNVPEFGLTFFTEPELFGTTNNPWDLKRTAGGSSGGAAAAVSSRMVPAAHGSDGGGSVRVPAACCGVVGLLPSLGRTPVGPDRTDLWQGLIRESILTRSVRDTAALLDVVQGPDPGARYYPPSPERPYLEEVERDPGRLRIAFTATPFMGKKVHPEAERGLKETVELLEGLGHDLVEAAPTIDRLSISKAYFTVVIAELKAEIEHFEAMLDKQASSEEFELATWVGALLGSRLSAQDFLHAQHTLEMMSRNLGQFFENYDLLLTPGIAEPPVKSGSLQLRGLQAIMLSVLARLNAGRLIELFGGIDSAVEDMFDFTPYTHIFNISGQPAISLPLYWTRDELPLGMQFAAKYAQEAMLFRLAGQLEAAKPWADRLPPVHA